MTIHLCGLRGADHTSQFICLFPAISLRIKKSLNHPRICVRRDSSVGVENGYGLGWPRGWTSRPSRSKIILLSTSSRPVRSSTQFLREEYLGSLPMDKAVGA
jgi:hypothetical protein